jgi:hypothetical protein
LTNVDEYFSALTSYRTGDPVPIVHQFSEAAHAAVANGTALVRDLADARAIWGARIRARRDAAVWDALDLLIRQPAVTVAVVQKAIGVSQPTAQTAIDRLVAASILRRHNEFRRNRVWVCDDVLTALDAFSQRSGRRYLGRV